MVDEIAHIIPTHERPGVAQRLIDSIHRQFPGSHIYICDDSKKPAVYDDAENVPSPAYDIGLSAKRNLLVQESDEPYIFVWDDDHMATEDTSMELFMEVMQKLDHVGIVSGEWVLAGSGRRDVWFLGDIFLEGPVRSHKPPEEIHYIDTSVGEVRYNDVMFAPNWFLGKREVVEAVPWDEELKLQEHTEWFTRIAAIRGARGSQRKCDRQWFNRYTERELGNADVEIDENGMIEVYTLGSFRNKSKLSHIGGLARKGNWIKLHHEYAEELLQKGLVYTKKEMDLARPFPIPDVDESVPLGVAFTPDTTCYHFRDHEHSQPDKYVEQRRRDVYWELKRQKFGVEEANLQQWTEYPWEEIDFVSPSEIDFSLGENYTVL